MAGFKVEYDRPEDKFAFISLDNIQFMLQELRGNTKVSDATGMYYGVVIRVTTDKFGNLFGHIQCKPENIYFNEIDNPDMNISYEGKRVSYRLSDTHGRKRAVSVKLV